MVFANFYEAIAELVAKYFYLLAVPVKILIFPGFGFVLGYITFMIWFERKFHARIHLRIGPFHVGPVMGLFQPIADALKLMGKEVIIPDPAVKPLYSLAPLAAVAISMLGIVVIPFGPIGPIPNWSIYPSSLSLLIVLAVFAARPLIIVSAGWASNSKYCTIGALRAAFQLYAYEVPLLLAIVGVVSVAGSFDLAQIVATQSNMWFVFSQPLGFIVFFLAMMAEVGRRPFDIPHAEQEIVFGWCTEYSGVQFLCFMLSEYVDLLIGSLLVTLLFLGGWQGPSVLPPLVWFLAKVVFVTVLMIMGRGAFPRIRIDQLLDAGWRILIPLAIIQIVLTMLLTGINSTWMPLVPR